MRGGRKAASDGGGRCHFAGDGGFGRSVPPAVRASGARLALFHGEARRAQLFQGFSSARGEMA